MRNVTTDAIAMMIETPKQSGPGMSRAFRVRSV